MCVVRLINQAETAEGLNKRLTAEIERLKAVAKAKAREDTKTIEKEV